MNKLMTRIAILTICLTMSACSNSTEHAEEFTKEDAKKIVDSEQDLCAVHNWYGDGVCDTFCENADSDCTAQCDALPVCEGDGEMEVETCSQSNRCREVTLCGATIICEDFNADPGCSDCDEGYAPAATCLEGADCYQNTGFCDDPARYCQAVDSCDAVPVCAADYLEVDSCPTDTDCVEVTECGSTISCRKDDRCEQPAQPMCPTDRYLIQTCPADSNCTEEVICGIMVSCMEGTIDCLMPPECPVGTTSVAVCDAARPCAELISCGIRLYCEDNVI